MKIALDATYSIGEQLSGVGLYSREILLGMAASHPEIRFDFCYRPHRYLRAWGTEAPENARIRILTERFGSRSADLFHGLNQRLPRIRLRRAVVTFHDLFVMTSEYSTREFRDRFTAQARDAAQRADLLIAVSEFTKQQLVALLGIEPARVKVVPHGIRPLAYPRCEQPREKVVLHVGAIQERKNVARLVEAFEALEAPWRLVLAGSSGYGAERISARIAASPARDRISVLGYVEADDLAAWYTRAAIFAFPSLDEGFGMPVLEAMAGGTPVITSNRSALPEVAGDGALLVDPLDTGALVHALRTMAADEVLRDQFAARGFERSRLFSWERAVRQTWEVYQEAAGLRHSASPAQSVNK